MKSVKIIADNEDGFILVMALMSLVILSLLGVAALSTSIYEINLSGNEKVYELELDFAESGAYAEGGKLGFVTDDDNAWYQVVNPDDQNKKLHPVIASIGDFDPGEDTTVTPGSVEFDDESTWPVANLANSNDAVDDKFDYSYLVTYLYPDVAPKEYGASFSAYQFRINSNKTIDIEVGGMKIGAKSTI